MRRASDTSPDSARQIREGVDLAVKLADRLQRSGPAGPAGGLTAARLRAAFCLAFSGENPL